MPNDYVIMSTSNLLNYLKGKSRDPMSLNYQLNTNYANIYRLDNDEIVLIPSTFQGDGILFKNSKSFDNMIANEIFPIENPDKSIFELEMKNILNIDKNIDIFQELLNNQFKLHYTTINKSILKTYYQNILSLYKKNGDNNKCLIPLVALVGQYIKDIKGGHWALIKRYGIYNPYYEPVIITSDNNIIFFADSLFRMIENKIDGFYVYFNYSSIQEPKTILADYILSGNNVNKL